MSDLYRLVYASKNLLQGSEAENSAAVSQILTASQRNNVHVGVTGALMFNDGAFAQVLEGPRQGVEATFERIQRDLRHGEVTVLQCAPVESRGFPNWSMAFVGHSLHARKLWSDLASESGFDLARLNGDEVFAMLHGLVLEEEGVSRAGLELTAVDRVEASPAEPLDIDQVRHELACLSQTLGKSKAVPAATATQKPDSNETAPVALAIFRAALASERARTTELRTELDTLQVALAEAEARERALLGDRNLWVQRAQLLAAALNQEAEMVRDAREGVPLRRVREPSADTTAA